MEFSFHLRWDTRLAYTVVYPIPSVCQHAQPSTPNAEGNPRNQPEISVRRSTAKSADRYKVGLEQPLRHRLRRDSLHPSRLARLEPSGNTRRKYDRNR